MEKGFYKHIINNSPVGYAYHRIICDANGNPCDYEYIEVNQAFEDMTGLKQSKIIGKRITKVLPSIINSEFDWISFYGEVALSGREENIEQYSEPLKKWYRVHAFSPKRGYFVVNTIDISAEKEQVQDLKMILETSEDYLNKQEELDYKKITDNILKLLEAKVTNLKGGFAICLI